MVKFEKSKAKTMWSADKRGRLMNPKHTQTHASMQVFFLIIVDGSVPGLETVCLRLSPEYCSGECICVCLPKALFHPLNGWFRLHNIFVCYDNQEDYLILTSKFLLVVEKKKKLLSN